MKIHELVVEMKMLERRLTLYEEKYGILSENFYKALMAAPLDSLAGGFNPSPPQARAAQYQKKSHSCAGFGLYRTEFAADH